jgi:hypothetical protein
MEKNANVARRIDTKTWITKKGDKKPIESLTPEELEEAILHIKDIKSAQLEKLARTELKEDALKCELYDRHTTRLTDEKILEVFENIPIRKRK